MRRWNLFENPRDKNPVVFCNPRQRVRVGPERRNGRSSEPRQRDVVRRRGGPYRVRRRSRDRGAPGNRAVRSGRARGHVRDDARDGRTGRAVDGGGVRGAAEPAGRTPRAAVVYGHADDAHGRGGRGARARGVDDGAGRPVPVQSGVPGRLRTAFFARQNHTAFCSNQSAIEILFFYNRVE